MKWQFEYCIKAMDSLKYNKPNAEFCIKMQNISIDIVTMIKLVTVVLQVDAGSGKPTLVYWNQLVFLFRYGVVED